MLDKKESRYLTTIQKTVGRAINQYGMINHGEKVAIGLSGGKDSSVLLETLALRRKRIPIRYELIAMHVNVRNITREIDLDYYSALCDELDVSFLHRSIEVDITRDPKKTVCFVCAWHRRKELFHMVKESGCTRLALGHHLDDAIETLFLNMTFNSSISSMPPRLPMFKGEFDLIRPLILLTEKEVKRYARIRQFPVVEAACAFSGTTRREDMKSVVFELIKMNPKAKRSIFTAMSNIHSDYLPPARPGPAMPRCL